MAHMRSRTLALVIAVAFASSVSATGQPSGTERKLTWCTVSEEEQAKCEKVSASIAGKRDEFGGDYRRLKCVMGANKENCMEWIDLEEADVVSVDPGLVYIASRYHSLIPIMQEVYGDRETHHYSVALIKRGSLPDVRAISDLKGKKACFAGVGTLAGWFVPVSTLMKHGGMDIRDCNNHVKTVISFFGPSCAVNSLIDRYNPLGDNSGDLCRICGGRVPGRKCTVRDPYSGYDGAVRCLADSGDVAFVKHSTLSHMDGVNPGDYQLLCRDGSRQSVSEYVKCNWGRVPSNALVTTTAKDSETRESYQRFFKKLMETTGDGRLENNPMSRVTGEDAYREEVTKLFGRGRGNLLLQDSTNDLREITGARQLYSSFLHENMHQITGVRACPIPTMTICINSDPEHEKCVRMKTALNAQMLKPQVNCYKTESQVKCMEAIKNRFADVAVFDASDVHDAGKRHGLIPFMSEIYDLGKPEYYVTAVVKEEDPSTDLTYLKNKNSCHPGMNTAAGWTVPLAVLISNGWIRQYPCDAIRTASEYFTKSCVPGALSRDYSSGGHDNLCELCHGSTYRLCKRSPSEDYFGTTGALRCLVEGGGHVAFVRHTTVSENADGKRKDIWARNLFSTDFELICVDGKRAEVKDYRNCSLGKVKANAIVTRGGRDYNDTEVDTFTNLMSYAQQFYGWKNDDYLRTWAKLHIGLRAWRYHPGAGCCVTDNFMPQESQELLLGQPGLHDYDNEALSNFGLFTSPSPYTNLIFQDATTRLEVIPAGERNYERYLGSDFLRAKRIVDCD